MLIIHNISEVESMIETDYTKKKKAVNKQK